jgi:hypothetical protein
MEEIFTFKKLITPPVVKALFWILSIAFIVVGFVHVIGVASTGGILYALAGLLFLVLGLITLRIYCEVILIFFFIQEAITELRESIDMIGESLKETKSILKQISQN